MGQKQVPTVEEELVYESVPLSAEDKQKAEKSVNKPLPGYAYIRDRRPKMYPEALKTYQELQQNLRIPFERGQKLPVYELAAMPGCFYDGQWKDGRPHGDGKIFGKNGIYYEGNFSQGVATSEDSIFIYPDGSFYQGQFKDNTFHGKGRFHYIPNGTMYSGDWRDDRPHGEGSQIYADKSKYEGSFQDGKKHGPGKYTWFDGKIYKGLFAEGHIHGKGKLMLKGQISQFEGIFERGMKAKGKLKTETGEYEGQFKGGLMHDSNASFRWYDGRMYVGPFEFGELHGNGSILCGNHKIRGVWERGRNISITSMQPC